MIFDLRSGSSVSADQYIDQVRNQVEARLKLMAIQLDIPNLNTNPDNVDLRALETAVEVFVETIGDREPQR